MIKEGYQSHSVGQEISCVMYGIEKTLLYDNKKISQIALDVLKKDNFEVHNINKHYFKPHGFTIMLLLAESHLAIHTYPEYNSIYFNLYSCRGPKDAEKTFNIFRENINPESILLLNKNEVPVKLFP